MKMNFLKSTLFSSANQTNPNLLLLFLIQWGGKFEPAHTDPS